MTACARRLTIRPGRRVPGALCLVAFVLACGVPAVQAQTTARPSPRREGFWIGFGVALADGRIDCGRCGPLLPDDPWNGGLGVGASVAAGSAVLPHLLVGGEFSLYARRSNAQERDATLFAAAALARYYPLGRSGFYLEGGGGAGGSILAGGPGLVESGGWSVQGGAGYDVHPGGGRFALSPFVTFVQVLSAGNVGDNRGAPSRGPRNPSYLQAGLGFHWY